MQGGACDSHRLAAAHPGNLDDAGWAIGRWTSLDTRDYARLLHLREDYGVTDLRVQDGDYVFHAGAVAEQERVSIAERTRASR